MSAPSMGESALAVVAGGLFGFALDKAHTNNPQVIAEQMEMRNFTMMRMFLAASGTSAAVVLALHALGIKQRKPSGGVALGFNLMGGYGANLVGGALLGAGMYLTGSCPGTVYAQLLTGTPFTASIMAGGVLGAMLFGYVEKHAREANPKFHTRHCSEKSDLVPSSVPYAVGSLVFMAAAAGAIFAINSVFPWQVASTKVLADPPALEGYYQGNVYAPDAQTWDPALAGVLLGLLQIPAQLSSGGALGQSSGWVLLGANCASLFDTDLKTNAPYHHASLMSAKAKYQLMLASGIMAGAALSQYLGGYPALAPEYANGCGSHATGFAGGMLLLLGSRLNMGCTSGAGLSGMAQLSIGSLVAVAGMFLGGMSAAAMAGNFVGM